MTRSAIYRNCPYTSAVAWNPQTICKQRDQSGMHQRFSETLSLCVVAYEQSELDAPTLANKERTANPHSMRDGASHVANQEDGERRTLSR